MSDFAYRATVTVEAPVADTEVTDRVRDAVANVFPEATIEERPGMVVAETHSLSAFSEGLHRQEILDTARGVFFDTLDGDRFSFALKKGAAFEGVVNFAVGEDELGPIEATVQVDDPDAETLIDHVAPPTEDGKPIERDDGR
jgi:predicted RNA binding protein with dsRBD fold (UPF0201 family)